MKALITKPSLQSNNRLTNHFLLKHNNPALMTKRMNSRVVPDYFSEVRPFLSLNDKTPPKRREVLVIQQVKPMLESKAQDEKCVAKLIKRNPFRVRPIKTYKSNISTKVISLEIDNNYTPIQNSSFDRNIKGKKTLLHYNHLRKYVQTTSKTRRNKMWQALPKSLDTHARTTLKDKAISSLTIRSKERVNNSTNSNYKTFLITRKNWLKKYNKSETNNRQLNLKNKLLETARKRAAIWERIRKTIDKSFNRFKNKEQCIRNAFLAKSPLTNFTMYS